VSFSAIWYSDVGVVGVVGGRVGGGGWAGMVGGRVGCDLG